LLTAVLFGPAPAFADLAAALQGVDQATFLRCSGPPMMSYPTGLPGQIAMSFVTNLQRGQAIGPFGPSAFPVASCSVDAVFKSNRLVSASFSGDQSMCAMVFSPCVPR
jgi:hypothetical protein